MQIGCQLDSLLAEPVTQAPILHSNGQSLLPQMILFMYVSLCPSFCKFKVDNNNFFYLVLQIIHDLDHLAAEVCGNYIGHVFKILNSCSPQVLDLVKNSILQGGKTLKDLVPSVIDSIIETLVEKSNEVLSRFLVFILICSIIHHNKRSLIHNYRN